MSYPEQELQPNTLYLTISVPEAQPHLIANTYDCDITALEHHNRATDDGSGTNIKGTDDFEWGIYWHRGPRNGTWYTLRRDCPEVRMRMPTLIHKINIYRSFEMKESPRLYHHVVGLVRLMEITGTVGSQITAYLDWLAPRAANKTSRSIVWAIAVYLRVRRHVAKARGQVDTGAIEFDSTGLICLSLKFAYREV
ncbi:hypothetical protein NM208_g9496 [Fusarium decemcellulare]|uniref:Uncharacterized protein n=1 Tax=Fusarium decemcellulare TaxID=57161 RepID=A0ACC1S1E9_9HYPO|nr:hypothetical protein NM208_g9496 [Fusarium decemcellulare]